MLPKNCLHQASPLESGEYINLQVNGFVFHIVKTDEGIVVDIQDPEVEDPDQALLGTDYAFDADLQVNQPPDQST